MRASLGVGSRSIGWFALALGAWACTGGSGSGSDADADADAVSDPTVDPGDPGDPGTGGPTFWGDVQPILAEACVSCHRPGDIGPFSLETYAEAAPWAEAMAMAVSAGTMPPWPPSADCAPLVGARTLPDDAVATIAAWADAGAPEGDPADAVDVSDPVPFASDASMVMAEPYAPDPLTDDYRCFVLDWPVTETAYVTSFQVEPGRRELVHHVILSVATGSALADARTLDDREAGPGYTCFGSSGVAAKGLGAWVPGVRSVDLPAGTGVEIPPGSAIIMQMHYNTVSTADPAADTTTLEVQTAPAVDYPAQSVLITNPAWLSPGLMAIPAGDPEVVLETALSRSLIALASGEGSLLGKTLRVHRAGLHMHTLGTSTRIDLERADGSSACMLDIPRWDFHWQGGYEFVDPFVMDDPDDQIRLSCTWDNSAPGAVDVDWGEGTSDEMCLAGLYVTE